MTMADLVLSHAPRGLMAARLAAVSVRLDVECYYFGCIERAGHFLWRRQGHGRPLDAYDVENTIRRTVGSLDAAAVGGLCWNSPKSQRDNSSSYDRDETEGRALLTRRNGWTAISFWDRSVDRRGACNSAFFCQGELTFAQIVRVARHRWPEIWALFTFPIVEVDGSGREVFGV